MRVSKSACAFCFACDSLVCVCILFLLCGFVCERIKDLIKPLFLDRPLRFSTVDITRTAEIYYFYSKHNFSVSPADMRNKILTIYLIRGVSFHSRIVSLKRSGSPVSYVINHLQGASYVLVRKFKGLWQRNG